MAKWQDSYQIGQKVEVLTCGEWVPAVVSHKTVTGQPEVRTLGAYPRSLGNGQLRKTDLRPLRFAAMPAGGVLATPELQPSLSEVQLEVAHKEHEAWLELVRQLQATGAVTQEDCESLATAVRTPGQRLFEAIRRWGALAATVACLLCAFVAAPAAAQDSRTVAEARSVFEAGQVAFNEGHYADALVYFQRSYALSRQPELLFNMALCHDRLRADDLATAVYERYLAEMPRASNRDEVERRLGALQIARERRAAVTPEHVAAVATERAGSGREGVPLAEVAPDKATAVYETWWFWTIVGVVVTGAAVGIGVAASGDAPLQEGDIGGVIYTLGS